MYQSPSVRNAVVASLLSATAGIIVLTAWLVGWPLWQEYAFAKIIVEAARRNDAVAFDKTVDKMRGKRGTAGVI